MPIKLYYAIYSPPARSVLHTLNALNLPYELIHVDLLKGENRSEEFIKLNPQHTVPTIQDEDGFVVWDSHAISIYLVDKYGKDDKLYPKDPRARALVDQKLHFNSGILFVSLKTTAKSIIKQKASTRTTDEMKIMFEEGYDFLEKFLKGNQYVAGKDVTIADFIILPSLTNSSVFAPLDDEKFPLIKAYMKRCKENIPGLKELEEKGMQSIKEILKSLQFEFES